LLAEAFSHVGNVRVNNEDSVLCDTANSLFIVADGIGGQEYGEIASALAVNITTETVMGDSDGDPLEVLCEAFYEANNVLYNTSLEGEKGAVGLHMGTTMTAARPNKDLISIVHVGDSRAYYINKDQINQLTKDHSLVGEMLREGSITAEEAHHHPQKNIITRSLGHEPFVLLDKITKSWSKGDYLLLCSDGLSNLVEEEELKWTVLNSVTLRQAVLRLTDMALKRGGYDNISVVLILND